MKRRLLTLGVVTVMVAAGLITWVLAPGGKSVSAAEVVQRAAAARTSLAARIAPATTLHMVEHRYSPNTPPLGSDPFVYPVHATNDTYQVFGGDGKLAALRTIGTDDDTGEIFATTELINGQLIDTDVRTGATFREPGNWANVTADQVSAAFGKAQSETGTLVDSAKSPRTATIGGADAYVIERADANGHVTNRLYIDKSTYREVRSENIASDGTVTKSEEIPVLESLGGEVLPTPAAVVATAIAAAQPVADATAAAH